MIFLKSIQTLGCFFSFNLGIISFLLHLIHFLVHFNKQVLHSLVISLFDIEFDLQGLASLVEAFFFGLFQCIELPQLGLFSFNLLFSELVYILCELVDPLFFILELSLYILCLSLEHENFSATLFSFSYSSHCSSLFFVQHAAQFPSFSLSPLFLLFVKLLNLLILTIFVDNGVL